MSETQCLWTLEWSSCLRVLHLDLKGLAAMNSQSFTTNSHLLALSQDGQEDCFEKWRVENSWGEDRGNKGKVIYNHRLSKVDQLISIKLLVCLSSICQFALDHKTIARYYRWKKKSSL